MPRHQYQYIPELDLKLTPKQIRFAQALVATGNRAEAVRIACGELKRPSQNAWNLIHTPKVRRYLAHLYAQSVLPALAVKTLEELMQPCGCNEPCKDTAHQRIRLDAAIAVISIAKTAMAAEGAARPRPDRRQPPWAEARRKLAAQFSPPASARAPAQEREETRPVSGHGTDVV